MDWYACLVDTVYLHLEFKTKSGGWSVNLPFVCNKCGVCCTLNDFLTAGEVKAGAKENPEIQAKVKALYDELGKIWEDDEGKYEDYIMHTPCPFLSSKICSIYEIRPEGCRRFPNTPFGMLSQDCEPLIRFKKQQAALKKGRKTSKAYHFIGQGESIKSSKLTKKQYLNCLAKLRKSGLTEDEFGLFEILNEQKKTIANVV